MTGTYTRRYDQLAEQRAYRRRVEAFGLAALLAPYSLPVPAPARPAARLPEQRRGK